MQSLMLEHLASAILAAALHEVAHVAVACVYGIRVKRIGVGLLGPYIVRETGLPLQNLVVTLAGPLMNVALAIVFWSVAPWFAACNLVLGLSNLLPIRGLDGHRALGLLRR